MTAPLSLGVGCAPDEPTDETSVDTGLEDTSEPEDTGQTDGWPTVTSEIPLDPEIESAIDTLLADMTLEQKVGQMMQAEIKAITPEEVKQYHIGSVLNGGGSWPSDNKNATAAEWVALADAYYDASMDTSGGDYKAIPILWGTDAVHGHSNVMGATVFPHNIGLGAAADPDLIRRIGEVTAKEVAVTGIDWTFAPTLAVVRDDRWGRTYEGYSEDPDIVRQYGGEMVRGLQGDPSESGLLGTDRVLATAKHFLGDGGTERGVDQGDTVLSEQELIDLHAQGYVTAIEAGAQTVMASFSSWNGEKMHGNPYLLTDVLRGPLGFDGLVVGDWNGHGQVPGCTNEQCAASINAGVDLVMVPFDWRELITNTLADVRNGDIPESRIDEAVRRILRVKMRAGLMGPYVDRGKPSSRPLAGDASLLGHPDHRALAREAVRKSQVLLKNKGGLLPLDASSRVLVAGKTANNIGLQSGGWTLTWQGTENVNSDFPNGQSIFDGISEAVGAAGGSATLSEFGTDASTDYDVIVAVIGERPYAEGQGDIGRSQTLEHALHHPEDLLLLNNLRTRAPGVPIVTLFVAGRPMYTNRELNRSDAFVAAWLPGTEGGGVADVLFGQYDFTGKLTFSWPAADCDTALHPENSEDALFPYGFGLSTADMDALGDDLPEVSSENGCISTDGSGTTDVPLELFTGGTNRGNWVLRIGGPSNWLGTDVGTTAALPDNEIVVDTVDGRIQGSAKRVTWNGTGEIYTDIDRRNPGEDLSIYANSNTELAFRARVQYINASVVNLSMHCGWPCLGEVPLGDKLREIADGQWHDIRVPLACFIGDGLDIYDVNRPFLLYAEGGTMQVDLEDMRWEPGTADDPPDCSVWRPIDVINQPEYRLYTDGIEPGLSFTSYNNDPTRETDLGDGNMAWVGVLSPNTNIGIRKEGLPADLSAYNVPGATLDFDLNVTFYSNDFVDLLVKVGTSWPNVSDLRLFSQVLGERPPTNTWVPVSIPADALIASPNDLESGIVDIQNVLELFVVESVDGSLEIQLDNIRWTLPDAQ